MKTIRATPTLEAIETISTIEAPDPAETTPEKPHFKIVSASPPPLETPEPTPETSIVQTLNFLFEDGQNFEVCALRPKNKKTTEWEGWARNMVIAYFDDPAIAVVKTMLVEQFGVPEAVYITLNPCDPALLGRAFNHFVVAENRTQDKEILHRSNFLIDVDAERPRGTSSTDKQHEAALLRTIEIEDYLTSLGWPRPMRCDSGNGGHLDYKLPKLDNTEENTVLIGNCLKGSARLFNDAGIKIDTSVGNAARITKLYGTWARKGDDTPLQPHRRSMVLSVPEKTEPVSIDLLKELAEEAIVTTRISKPKATKLKAIGKFDVAKYLEKHKVAVKAIKPHGTSTLYVLDRCVFDKSHSGGEASIVQSEDGKLSYQCFHTSCKGKTWKDARKIISGDESLSDGSGKGTQAQQLIELASSAVLFHTTDDGRYAIFMVDGHREIWPINGKIFRDWLSNRFYEDQGKPPGTQALQEVIHLLEAKARFEGDNHPVSVRVGKHGCNVYLDLCNVTWEAVEITPSGWRVISDPPIKFSRAKSMLPLPQPEQGGNLNDLRPFLNIPDEKAFLLFCSFLVQALNPNGPYPILALEGEQGTAKSSTARILRSLIDPSTAMLKAAPHNDRDLMISASNSWVLAYDNLITLPDWLSNALCRLATGGGFSTRALWTNGEEVIFDATRPQILTGIDRISSRHDLVDREIIVILPVIPEDKRREEGEMLAKFEAVKPRILGALCDAVSSALANFGSTILPLKPRMADFARWVSAAEPALPWKPGEFLKAYTGNRTVAISLALESDLIASAVQQFMEGKPIWDGLAALLLKELTERASEETRKLPAWPKTPSALGHSLRLAASFLRASGLDVVFPKPGDWRRNITIKKFR